MSPAATIVTVTGRGVVAGGVVTPGLGPVVGVGNGGRCVPGAGGMRVGGRAEGVADASGEGSTEPAVPDPPKTTSEGAGDGASDGDEDGDEDAMPLRGPRAPKARTTDATTTATS